MLYHLILQIDTYNLYIPRLYALSGPMVFLRQFFFLNLDFEFFLKATSLFLKYQIKLLSWPIQNLKGVNPRISFQVHNLIKLKLCIHFDYWLTLSQSTAFQY